MTVCVFDPSTNILTADRTAVGGEFYSANQRKLHQVHCVSDIYTIATSGVSWVSSLALRTLADELRSKPWHEIDWVSHQAMISGAVRSCVEEGVPFDSYDIMVVKYNRETEKVSVFKLNNVFIPFEMTPAPGDLAGVGSLDMVAMVKFATQQLRTFAAHHQLSPPRVGEVMKQLGGHHIYAIHQDVDEVEVTWFNEEYAYVP